MGKDIRIAVRVAAKEKEKIQSRARKCRLSTTEYVKQRALGYKPRGIPPDALFLCLEKLSELADKAISPEQAFEIGKATARRMWCDKYQVLVTVHLNTDNVHCHFVVNPVSFKDGTKFQNKIGDHKELRRGTDVHKGFNKHTGTYNHISKNAHFSLILFYGTMYLQRRILHYES